ncbi:hypothetical protein [Streptomyces yaizuensis]|uniref:Phage or prophage related protein n=1 Tax=Streptomyces yaizuensis TaxID=2989713 RepID=A0ABQ5NYV4_9ACTN|nr:hypothetical protein [Streptomyces sp. YSPA8]GLF95531.1 phage or prophage related protein [Streptomyces sp. YSPA8]
MPRIRTIKPEAFRSESLAAVSLSAERTFLGLLTEADDYGRFRDQPAVLAGALWSYRPGHGPLGVEDDLTQLAAHNLICRYTVHEDGENRRYAHIVTWRKHQKINRPSGVRTPPCPHHEALAVPPATTVVPEPAVRAHGALTEDAVRTHGGLTEGSVSPHGALKQSAAHGKTAGQAALSEPSLSTHGGLSEPSVRAHGPDLGPRNLDLGTTTRGASAPAPRTVSAKQLITEYEAACAHRPPSGVLGHLGRETARLLAEGIDPDHVRAGLARHRTRGLHPSTLPSLVHEAMNAGGGLDRPGFPATVPARRAWANPADPAAAYAEEL